jgi:hypothetical protein
MKGYSRLLVPVGVIVLEEVAQHLGRRNLVLDPTEVQA